MKALIAIACTAVIAAVGYYFWGEFSDARARSAAQSAHEADLAQLTAFAQAAPGDNARISEYCSAVAGSLKYGIGGQRRETANRLCVRLGFR